jgi:hypothetical protein
LIKSANGKIALLFDRGLKTKNGSLPAVKLIMILSEIVAAVIEYRKGGEIK